MSWADTKVHEDNYRKARLEARNNQRRQEWFTTPLESTSTLFDTVYSRDDENEAWKKEYDKQRSADIEKLVSWRIRIAILCSSTRDLRSQFAAWSGHRVRVPLDWDRFEHSRLGFRRMRADMLDQIIQFKEKGSPKVKDIN